MSSSDSVLQSSPDAILDSGVQRIALGRIGTPLAACAGKVCTDASGQQKGVEKKSIVDDGGKEDGSSTVTGGDADTFMGRLSVGDLPFRLGTFLIFRGLLDVI